MSFESFYGGRMGASFVIVDHFDGIFIDQTSAPVYKGEYLAVTNDKQYFIFNDNFIVRNQDNYNTYNWKFCLLDGQDVLTKTNAAGTGATSTETLPISLARGMVQCFMQGGETTDQVNYGEYVIIDTPDKQHPDNGKVYRRGMNYVYSPTDNPLAGAEYIGQIVGPMGASPEIDLDHYDTISESTGAKTTKTYSETSGDLIPGSVVNASTGTRIYNDNIEWIYVTFRDDAGNVTGCKVGFKLPTLVMDFEASSINSYDSTYRRGSGTSADPYRYENLISEDPSQYVDGEWVHPFYEKWQVKVPQGIHGDDSTNIEVIHTMTMPAGHKENFAGTAVYDDENCTVQHYESGSPLVLTTSVNTLREVEGNVYRGNIYSPIYDVTTKSCKITYGGNTLYVKKEDCYVDVIRYRETDYDNYEDGEIRFYYIGELNQIQRITLSEYGILTAFYSNIGTQTLEEAIRWIRKDSTTKGIDVDVNGNVTVNYNTLDSHGNYEFDTFSNVIRWIDNTSTNGIQLDNDGTVTITYNTLHDDGTGTMVHDQEVYPNILDWITKVTLQQNGDFEILYNNNTIQGGKYFNTLNWIDFIDVEADGTVKFYFNSNHGIPAFTFNKILKYLNNVNIQTIAPGSTLEGSGDQKVHITYNTTDASGNLDTAVIGNPLNYIIETAICSPTTAYPTVPYSHLLVYYADPALRASLFSKWVTYPSTKYPGQVWTEWVDLGDVKGETGGLRILEDVSSLNDLQDPSTGVWIPPEQLKDSTGMIIDPNAAGWSVTITPIGASASDIYCYDYNHKIWYYIGTIDPGTMDVRNVIIKSSPDINKQPLPTDVALLKDKGFWFAKEIGYFAE